MKKLILAATVLGLFTTPVLAQDAAAPEEPLSNEDVMTVAIGCVATYDTVIAQGKAGADEAVIRKARAFALAVYKEFSGESDEQIATDVTDSARIFPEMLKDSQVTLEEFRETCDAIFVDDEEGDAAPTA